MSKEIESLQNSLSTPKKPLLAIIGGSKIRTKIDILKNLNDKVDTMIIGGAMANTFLRAKGINIGASLFESQSIDIAKDIINDAKKKNVNLVIPIDGNVSKSLSMNVVAKNKYIEDIEADDMILDLGVESIKIILNELKKAKTVIWNGPLGAIEYKPFDQATITVARELARNCKLNNIKVVAGGGDTIYGINLSKCIEDFTHVSTAGGAFLEWLEGKTLPGVSAILDK
jgi:phosphoglycerate kinase